MNNFTLKYSKNNDLFTYNLFCVSRTLFSAIFGVFHFMFNFRDFSVFSVSRKTCYSRIA